MCVFYIISISILSNSSFPSSYTKPNRNYYQLHFQIEITSDFFLFNFSLNIFCDLSRVKICSCFLFLFYLILIESYSYWFWNWEDEKLEEKIVKFYLQKNARRN